MRKKLQLFRIERNFTQKQMADKMGVSLACYQSVESGTRNGSTTFLEKLKNTFELTGDKTFELMEVTENEPNREENNCSTN